jgi:hypothetical protein
MIVRVGAEALEPARIIAGTAEAAPLTAAAIIAPEPAITGLAAIALSLPAILSGTPAVAVAEHHSAVAALAPVFVTASPAALAPVAVSIVAATFVEIAVSSIAVAKIAMRHVQFSLPRESRPCGLAI